MKEYVAGLLFSKNKKYIALIHKKRGPSALIGKWNAPGGKVEAGEEPIDAMRREFKEETGVAVPFWYQFLVLSGDGWRVTFFVAFNNQVDLVRTMEEETVMPLCVGYMLAGSDLVPNMRWIIPMALCFSGDENVDSYSVQEVIAA